MTVAICPGSYDPITLGHLDIIKRTASLFDKVIVVVMLNASKKPTFTVEERKDFLRRVTKGLENVEIDTYDGLLATYAELKDATAVVKGLRVMSDFEYEFQMALTNMSLSPKTETIFLPSRIECMFLSSSMVREVAKNHGDITGFVPAEIVSDITQKLNGKGDNKNES